MDYSLGAALAYGGGGGGGSTVVSRTATAAEAIAARDLVYLKADGTVARADATAEGKEALAYVTAAAGQGAAATYYFGGNIISGFLGLTSGAAYYLSTTPGAIVPLASAPSAAGNVLMKVGTAISSSELLFAPEAPITL